jgi:hypothetical protein
MSEEQSNTQIPTELTSARIPHQPAPLTPVPGAALAAPLTGQGLHRAGDAQHNKDRQPSKPKNAVPPPAPRRRPRTPPVAGTADGQWTDHQAVDQPVQPFGPAVAAMGPAMASMLTQLMNSQRPPAQKFMLVVLPEDDWPRVEEYNDISELIASIQTLLGTPCHLFPFLGNKLTITQGPNHFLLTPMGPIPLFTLPEPAEDNAVEHGWVGPERAMPQPPTARQVEQARHDREAEEDAAQALVNEEMDAEFDEADSEDQPPVEDGTPMFG